MSSRCMRPILGAIAIILSQASNAWAQTGAISGTVVSEAGEKIVGATVMIHGAGIGVAADESGAFFVRSIHPGTYDVRVSFIGYRTAVQAVEVVAGETTQVRIVLTVRPVQVSGIEVSLLRPDLGRMTQLAGRAVREANPKDTGELMRKIPGTDAGRRGAMGLDPVVRALRETQVGVYLDGTRMFPGGLARMDSPLTHVDPSTLVSLEVIKGPYALTWGAGNLSAIRVETQDIPSDATGVKGRALFGLDVNALADLSESTPGLNAGEGFLGLFGNAGRFYYWGHGVVRNVNDYQSGSGQTVPSDYVSREARGKMGYRLTDDSRLTVSGGYQRQEDVDYPGLILDAEFFNTYNLLGHYELERSAGTLRSIDVLAYVNDVDHGMNNDNKPTAQPNPDRIPPFGLDVQVESGINVKGGRLATTLAPGGPWELELGGDVYSADRKAIRTIANRETGMTMFEDLMWPDATTTDAGLFVRAESPFGRIFSASGAVRVDFIESKADTASEFFLENVSQDLDASETNWNGSLTVSAEASRHWVVSAGFGSAARTADASERYSDRMPASKAQTSAEFVGNPALKPERSTELDLWLEGGYSGVGFYVNGFYRWMDDNITIVATDLPKRLPLSPDTVFQYVNGQARFFGFEASATWAPVDELTTWLTGAYLRGQDETLDEPALGVSPPMGDWGVRYEPLSGVYFVQSALHVAAKQDRVAEKRGETPTEGYVTFDIQGGVQLRPGVQFRAGVSNLFNEDYTNHLNAKNPFTGQRIPEPGRTWFAKLSYVW